MKSERTLIHFFEMDIDLRSIVLYLDKKGLSPGDILNDINETLGPNKIKYSTITKYFDIIHL